MKTILAFDTSSPVLSVALGTAQGEIFEARSQKQLRHSENLIPLVDRLLKKGRLHLDQMDAFAIDRGPGSFTGLRIGFSLLKGFLASRKKPCYGALSLDIMGEKIHLPEGTRLGVLIDARREAIYSRFYQRRKGKWIAEGKLKLLSLAELMDQFSEGTYLVGDALIRYHEVLLKGFKGQLHFMEEELTYPSASSLVKWFQAEDPFLTCLKTPSDYLPLYFRASEAEEKRRKGKHHGA